MAAVLPSPMPSFQISIPILLLLPLILIASHPSAAQQLPPSQSKALIRLQQALEYPPALAGWTPYTAFCSLPSSPYLSLSCSGVRLTRLAIAGDGPRQPLSPAFSVDSLFTTLSRFPNLTELSLVSLGIWGPLPAKLHRLSSLQALNLSSNHLNGAIPLEISLLPNLKSLVLSGNSFNGTVPDLRSLTVLDELDLGGNLLGPEFPSLDGSVTILVLQNNSFHASIPLNLASFNQLQKLDLSSNRLNGPVPPFLFSLPSIRFLDLSGNHLVGALPSTLSCGDGLGYVDLSSNLLVGSLPSCIQANSSGRTVLNSWNCMSSADPRYQHPGSYCNEGALAAVLPPVDKKIESKSKLSLILGIVAAIVGGVAVLGLSLLVILKRRAGTMEGKLLLKPVHGNASIQIPPRTPADTRHMSQAVRIGTLGLTAYHVFTMEELEEATNSFDPSNLIEDGPRGQFYKGRLQDCSTVVVRCMKSRQKHSPQSLLQYIDIISKLRHCHLVSILGHCIDSDQDNANTTTIIFLVYEYASNGTLRSHLTEWRKREMLKWPQRVAAVIGVARGIQYLHTVTVPGIVGNDLNMENILLDETLTAKISNYNLPTLSKNKNNKIFSGNPFSPVEDSDLGSFPSLEHGEKEDVYQLGLILLEVITGKPGQSQDELEKLKVQLNKSLNEDPAKLWGMTDPTIRGTFAYESLRTAVETTLNCIAKDPSKRPSIDDVLWNLQYTVQVQDGWASSESLSTQS